VLTNGAVYCWGWNGHAELGDGTFTDKHTPVAAHSVSSATAVGVGYYHTCVISGGQLGCWGWGGHGQLGDGMVTQQTMAVGVVGLDIADPPPAPSTYHAMEPVRLLDTRYNNGLNGKFVANTPRTFQVAGRGGVPSGASAVTGNVTVVDSTGGWAVYLGPTPAQNPATSTVNFGAGEIVANGLTVALSSKGTLSATYMGAAGWTTNLVFDVTGYYTPDMSGATYHPIDPVRLLDTRYNNGLDEPLQANAPVTFQVTGRGGVPENATAVTGNVTVVNSTNAWAVYVGPVSTAKPTTSSINFTMGQIKANNLTVSLSSSGTLSATYLSTDGNSTDLVIDVTGYYTDDSSGSAFTPIFPARLLDTRIGNGLTSRFKANIPRTFSVAGRGGVPLTATGVTGNVTAVQPTNAWAMYVGPISTDSPTTSNVNFSKNEVKANGLTVALSQVGALSATYMSTSGNSIDLVFDVTGYFAPPVR
jgi:hypothetical protein